MASTFFVSALTEPEGSEKLQTADGLFFVIWKVQFARSGEDRKNQGEGRHEIEGDSEGIQ